jgi:hypothetical protein
VLFVLGFLSVGDGVREAQRLLGLLDLPNLTSMETKTFMRIEKEIAPVIIAIAEEALQNNLILEVEASEEDYPVGLDFEKWKEAVLRKDYTYPKHLFAPVRAGTDMGWQQHRTVHDPLSGHAFLFGANTAGTNHWLKMHDKRREKKCCFQQSTETKRKQRKVYYKALRKKTEQARRDIERGIGYYRNAVQSADAAENIENKEKVTKACRCGSTTHQRITSLQCPLTCIYQDADPLVVEGMKKDQDEQAVMDTLTANQVNIARKLGSLDDDDDDDVVSDN